jgi:hypothetical protein
VTGNLQDEDAAVLQALSPILFQSAAIVSSHFSSFSPLLRLIAARLDVLQGALHLFAGALCMRGSSLTASVVMQPCHPVSDRH